MCIRVAIHKLMKDHVDKFRSKHHDWPELVAFINSRHTGRRIKKKKPSNKEEIMPSEGIMPISLSEKNKETVDTDGQTDSFDFLNRNTKCRTSDSVGKQEESSNRDSSEDGEEERRVEGKQEESCDGDSSDDGEDERRVEGKQEESSNGDSSDDGELLLRNRMTESGVKKHKQESSKEESGDKEESDEEEDSEVDNSSKEESNSSNNEEESGEEENLSNKEQSSDNEEDAQTCTQSNLKPQTTKQGVTLVQKKKGAKIVGLDEQDCKRSPNPVNIITNRDMVVKQLNLDEASMDFVEEEDISRPVITQEAASETPKKVHKSSFFLGGNSDSEEEHVEERNKDEDEEEDEGEEIRQGKRMMESTFIGQLSESSSSFKHTNKRFEIKLPFYSFYII